MFTGNLGAFSFSKLLSDIKQIAATGENILKKPSTPAAITPAQAAASPMSSTASGVISPYLLYGGLAALGLGALLIFKKKKR